MIRHKGSPVIPGGEAPGVNLQVLACSDIPEVVVKAYLARFYHLHFHFPQAGGGPPAGW